MSLGGRPCAQGKKREIVPAVPLTWKARGLNYARQAAQFAKDAEIPAGWRPAPATPRQRRRMEKKQRHHKARERTP